MPYFQERLLALLSFPMLMALGGCNASPDCDTPETRTAVLQSVADDHRNPLLGFAAKSATTQGNLKDTVPLYTLGDKIVTSSKSKDGRTLQCSGAISATVGDTKASKEIDFTVQRSSDGKISVSIVPFQFDASTPSG